MKNSSMVYNMCYMNTIHSHKIHHFGISFDLQHPPSCCFFPIYELFHVASLDSKQYIQVFYKRVFLFKQVSQTLPCLSLVSKQIVPPQTSATGWTSVAFSGQCLEYLFLAMSIFKPDGRLSYSVSYFSNEIHWNKL